MSESFIPPVPQLTEGQDLSTPTQIEKKGRRISLLRIALSATLLLIGIGYANYYLHVRPRDLTQSQSSVLAQVDPQNSLVYQQIVDANQKLYALDLTTHDSENLTINVNWAVKGSDSQELYYQPKNSVKEIKILNLATGETRDFPIFGNLSANMTSVRVEEPNWVSSDGNWILLYAEFTYPCADEQGSNDDCSSVMSLENGYYLASRQSVYRPLEQDEIRVSSWDVDKGALYFTSENSLGELSLSDNFVSQAVEIIDSGTGVSYFSRLTDDNTKLIIHEVGEDGKSSLLTKDLETNNYSLIAESSVVDGISSDFVSLSDNVLYIMKDEFDSSYVLYRYNLESGTTTKFAGDKQFADLTFSETSHGANYFLRIVEDGEEPISYIATIDLENGQIKRVSDESVMTSFVSLP